MRKGYDNNMGKWSYADMNDKEYGGYLPIELPLNEELYTGSDVMALNSGRYAIIMAI